MLKSLIKDKVYYKIFDYNYKESSHIYAFNIADCHNKTEEAIKNQQLIKDYYQVNDLLILKQIHSNIVIDADNLDNITLEPDGDGIVTTRKNLILAIQTSDCVPILFASNDGSIIGAAHSGWKGAKNNISKVVIDKMQRKGAKEIVAYIGPCIKQASYEINQEFYDNFLSDSTNYQKFFLPASKDHYYFNLFDFVKCQLEKEGISNITYTLDDTYTMPNIYPSYRYKKHNNLVNTDTILSTIVIKSIC